MELNVKEEKAMVEGEIRELNARLAELDAERQKVVNELVRREGILHFLDRLDQHKEEVS